MSNQFSVGRSAGVRHHCIVVRSTVEVSYSVSDFDSGDLNPGDTATCQVTVDVPAGYTVELHPIAGYDISGSAPNFSVSWSWQGENNPQQDLSADIIAPDGAAGVLTGGDFYLCSGGGEDPIVELIGEGSVKEFCSRNKPSTWQGEDGEPVDPDTLEFCEVPRQYQTDCWQQRFYECGLDNTFTSFRDTGASITLKFADCPDASFDIPDGTGGWTAQVAAIADGLASVLPDSFQHTTFCTNGCAGLPEPVVDLPDMRWRYAGWRTCPGDKTPIEAVYNSDQRKDVLLDLNVVFTPIQYFDRCIDIESKLVEWRDCRTGDIVDADLIVDGKPLCAIPCAASYPELPNIELCDRGIESGCFFTPGEDGPVQTLAGVTLLWKNCGDLQQVQYVTNYGDDTQEEVQIPEGGYFGDCATGEPIQPAPPECTIDDALTTCPNACAESATRLTAGRPNNNVTVDYAGVSGSTFNEFVAAWEASGGKHYITNQNGTGDGTGSIEAHWICPAVAGAVVLFDGEPIENGLTISPNPMAEQLGCVPEKTLRVSLCGGSDGADVLSCVEGGGDSQSDPVTHTTQDNNTDFTWSYNSTGLKLQGQDPFNSPDAAPFFDAIVACIEGGGKAKITFTNPDGVVGEFVADTVVNDGYTTGFFTGVGDTTLLQSGKVRTATTVCCNDGEAAEYFKALAVKLCGFDEINSKLCEIANNTAPARQVQVLALCDDVEGDGSNLVPIFVQYTLEQGQPVLTEIFSDVALTQVYNIGDRTPVDCDTGEPVEPPEPLPLESNHLIEGCVEVEVDGETEIAKAFTIVNQAGAPLFAPRPLTELGFVDCCPTVEVPE